MHHVREFKDNFTPSDGVAMDATGHAASSTLNADPHQSYAFVGRGLDSDTHEVDSTVRNLCFVWPDGRRAFFNYAYLVAVHLTLQDQTNTLMLSFGSFSVTLQGYHLVTLFTTLLEHKPKIIMAFHPRYLGEANDQEPVVIEIIVKSE